MITIGQLARYAGVSTKTVRVYQDKGLLAEPGRDASGYRRYTAQHAVDLVKIRTLARAGVPLARIRALKDASDEEFHQTLQQVDADLTARIAGLLDARQRLRRLAAGRIRMLPDEVVDHLERLPGMGFSARWVAMENDLWILVFAAHPDAAGGLFQDQAGALEDPGLRRIYLDYDRAHDLDPADSRIDDLAGRIVAATRRRYGTGDLPGQGTGDGVPSLVQGAVNAMSPAWERLDALIRSGL